MFMMFTAPFLPMLGLDILPTSLPIFCCNLLSLNSFFSMARANIRL